MLNNSANFEEPKLGVLLEKDIGLIALNFFKFRSKELRKLVLQ